MDYGRASIPACTLCIAQIPKTISEISTMSRWPLVGRNYSAAPGQTSLRQVEAALFEGVSPRPQESRSFLSCTERLFTSESCSRY